MLSRSESIAPLAVGLTLLIGVGVGLGAGRLIDDKADPVPAAEATKVIPDRVGRGEKSAAPEKNRGRKSALPEASDDATALQYPDRERLDAALKLGAATAKRFGGTVEAAILLPGWSQPLTVGNPRRRSRMWSLAKPVTAIAAQRAPGGPTPAVRAAIQVAIQRSENCAQRRVVLEVQELAGGMSEAKDGLVEIIRESGARVVTTDQAAPAPPACEAYLRKTGEGLKDPLGSTLQLGTWTWTVADAVQFAAGLGNGTYREAGAAVVLDMERPKRASSEATSEEHTMTPDFGAGKVWPQVAYKSGWGGSLQDDFVVGQYGSVEGGGSIVAFAVVFHPGAAHQPEIDDPGRTRADEAIQAVLNPVKLALAE